MATEPCLPKTEVKATLFTDPPLDSSSSECRRREFWSFLRHNPIGVTACVTEVALTISVFIFTWWLSRQVYDCPDWVIDCTVTTPIIFFKANSRLLQGVLTTAYNIGLTALLGTVCSLAEAAVWPILHQRTYTLAQLDTYLKASRGYLISQPFALMAARSWDAAVVILCVFVSAALGPLGATNVGYALSLQNITVTNMASNVTVGAGIGLRFGQIFPGPPPLPGAVVGAFNHMSSWGNSFSTEPLPEYRDYIVDRRSLARVGNMIALAVRIDKSIHCTPRSLELSAGGNGQTIKVATTFPKNDSAVHIRTQARLTAWVDNVEVLNSNRSVSTVIFAVPNGTIEGGGITDPTGIDSMKTFTDGIYAIACDIDVELQNSVITIRESTTERGNLSTVSSFAGNMARGSATTVFGIDVHGTQPMYENGTNGMTIWTSTGFDFKDYWSLAEIHKFINVSAGAVAMRMPGYIQDAHPATIFSQYSAPQLDHRRSYILLFPVSTILSMTLVLAWRNVAMHSRMRIPAICLATVSDILKSSQTADIREGRHFGCFGSHYAIESRCHRGTVWFVPW